MCHVLLFATLDTSSTQRHSDTLCIPVVINFLVINFHKRMCVWLIMFCVLFSVLHSQVHSPWQTLLQPSANEILKGIRALFLQVKSSMSFRIFYRNNFIRRSVDSNTESLHICTWNGYSPEQNKTNLVPATKSTWTDNNSEANRTQRFRYTFSLSCTSCSRCSSLLFSEPFIFSTYYEHGQRRD